MPLAATTARPREGLPLKPPVTLNHIGIAAADMPALRKLFSILGLTVGHAEPVPDQGVVTHFLPIAAPTDATTNLELLEPTDPQGTVAQFIQKRGAGIHHLSFSVPQGRLDGICQELRDAGYRLTYDQPRLGAHRMRINFIHPASAGGILIELMEPA